MKESKSLRCAPSAPLRATQAVFEAVASVLLLWLTLRWGLVQSLKIRLLAMLHGGNGLRTIINDYASKPGTRTTLKVLLYLAVVLTIGLGSMVIFTFDPNIA